MPLPFTLLDVSALLSVFLAWHSAYLSQSLTPHLKPPPSFRLAGVSVAERDAFVPPRVRKEAEFAQASANRLGIASLVLGAVQLLYVRQRAVGRWTADGHVFEQYTLPLVALLAETLLFSMVALNHPVVSGRMHELLWPSMDPLAGSFRSILVGVALLLALPWTSFPGPRGDATTVGAGVGAGGRVLGVLSALALGWMAMGIAHSGQPAIKPHGAWERLVFPPLPPRFVSGAGDAVSGGKTSAKLKPPSVRERKAQTTSDPDDVPSCTGVPQAKQKSNEHREKGKNVDLIADTTPSQCAEGCTALKLKCDDCEDTCENELMRKLAPLCDEKSKDEFKGADLRPRYLKDIVGKKLLPLDDCGNVDCAALIAWELPGLLFEYSEDGPRENKDEYKGFGPDGGKVYSRVKHALELSTAPLLETRLDTLGKASPKGDGPWGKDLGGEPQNDGTLAQDLTKLYRWHEKFVVAAKDLLQRGDSIVRDFPVEGQTACIQPCVAKMASSDPEEGPTLVKSMMHGDTNPCWKKPPTIPMTPATKWGDAFAAVTKPTMAMTAVAVTHHLKSEAEDLCDWSRKTWQKVHSCRACAEDHRQGACPLLTPDGVDITEKQPSDWPSPVPKARQKPDIMDYIRPIIVLVIDALYLGFPAALGYMLVLALLALTIMGALMGKVEAVRPWLSFIESRLLVLQAPWLATHDAPPPKPPEPVHGFNEYGFVKPVECWPVDSEHCKAAKAAGEKAKSN